MPYAVHRELVNIGVAGGAVEGMLALPADPLGIVLFAHGSGSGRTSPRNNRVAAQLRSAGLATLLMDLLTGIEERGSAIRFDIGLLSARLDLAGRWLDSHRLTAGLPLCLFGASTGAAAALRMAAHQPERVRAVVARGGRPDLAGIPVLRALRAPTLLLVGGLDLEVLELNRRAAGAMRCEHALTVIPGATHLFEESGALDEVAALAARWFLGHLPVPAARP